MATTWDPAQYHRFTDERRAPFDDLLALVEPCPGGRVVDLGCGTGELTVELHRHTGAASTLGVDSSPAMLERAATHAGGGLSFERGEIETWGARDLDVVFSNAALHWIEDQESLVPRLRAALGAGGQLAFQVPANGDHPSQRLAVELSAEQPYLDAFGGTAPGGANDAVLPPERYATILDGLGARQAQVRLQVYGHHLASTEDVVEWAKGTTLTRIRAGLDDELFERYLAEYRRRVLDALGSASPYFFTYKRILAWARFP